MQCLDRLSAVQRVHADRTLECLLPDPTLAAGLDKVAGSVCVCTVCARGLGCLARWVCVFVVIAVWAAHTMLSQPWRCRLCWLARLLVCVLEQRVGCV